MTLYPIWVGAQGPAPFKVAVLADNLMGVLLYAPTVMWFCHLGRIGAIAFSIPKSAIAYRLSVLLYPYFCLVLRHPMN
ncbi:MAG: hypothetical protein RIB93_15375 [Coleofasciculus sp. D1-CHI-01]|uniref:hypothetical protein n=1 Tax=Coleofasciculus sp. D1-CHI-01 TaxID=3068482 RepID=UPI003304DB45